MNRPRPRTKPPSGSPQTVRILVHVKPRASRSRVLGPRDGVLEVSVAAAPVDGEANRELVNILSDHFGVPKSNVSIVTGTSARHKWIDLAGVDPARLAACLGSGTSR